MNEPELMKNRHTLETSVICSDLVRFETAINDSKFLFIFHLKFEDDEEAYQQELLLSLVLMYDTLKEEFKNKKLGCFGGREDTEIEGCPYNTFICLTANTDEFSPREMPILLKTYLEALQSNIARITGRRYDDFAEYVINKHRSCLKKLKPTYVRDEKECGLATRRIQMTLSFNREPSYIAKAQMAHLHTHGWIKDNNDKNIVYRN